MHVIIPNNHQKTYYNLLYELVNNGQKTFLAICPFFIGERRYHCFAHIPTDKAFSSDSLWNVEHVQEMDESDPLNDLEDYNHEVLKEVIILWGFIEECSLAPVDIVLKGYEIDGRFQEPAELYGLKHQNVRENYLNFCSKWILLWLQLSNHPALMKAHADKAISDENREKIVPKQESSRLKGIVTKATFAKLTTAPVVMTTEAPTTTTVSMTTTDVEVSRKTTLTSDGKKPWTFLKNINYMFATLLNWTLLLLYPLLSDENIGFILISKPTCLSFVI